MGSEEDAASKSLSNPSLQNDSGSQRPDTSLLTPLANDFTNANIINTGINGTTDRLDSSQEPTLDPHTPTNGTMEMETGELAGDTSAGYAATGEDGHDWAPDSDHESKRVKVYELIGSRWVDQGTAFCFGQFQEETNEALLLARAEASYNNIILSTAIRSNDVYQRQQETLIVWTEPDGVDYALSFQDPEGCAEVWNFILEVQRHMNLGEDHPAIDTASPNGPEPLVTTAGIIRAGHLPTPALGIMGEVEKAIKALARTQAVKERICEYIQQEEYIKSMVEVMSQAEDLDSLENMHALCSCMQTILMLNDHAMYEHILDDEVFFGVIAMLEYDPEFPTYKANYREFLQQNAHFHQPIPIRDETIQRKIHHTYRLQFLKDVVLARALDDSTFNVLNSCILFNQIDIIQHVQQDPEFLREVVGLYVDEDMLSGGGARQQHNEEGCTEKVEMREDCKPNGVARNGTPFAHGPPEALSEDDIRHRHEVVLLIQQLCVMGKNVQLPARMALFRTLVDRGILFAVQWALSLSERDAESRLMISTGGEILSALLDHDLNGVRGHVLKQVVAIDKERDAGKRGADKAETVLALMCRMMASSRDLAVQSQIGDALKLLLEIPRPTPEGEQHTAMSVKIATARVKDDPGTEKFLDYFYKHCIDVLLKPMEDIPEFKSFTEPVLPLSWEKTNMYVYLCDLLCVFSLQHTFRIHFYLLNSKIYLRIATLMRGKDKHLRLAAFRFFRLALKMDNRTILNTYLKHDVFQPIIELTVRESRRDNLLSSSCHEFFEHMRRENIKPFISHCMTRHEASIRKLAEMPLCGAQFISFIRRWEINNEPPPPDKPKSPKSLGRLLPGHVQRMEAEAEDDYFIGGDDLADDAPPPYIQSVFHVAPGPLSPSVPSSSTLAKGTKRKRQIGFRPLLTRTPPPMASLGALVDYGEEDENGPGSSTSDVPASPRMAHRQIGATMTNTPLLAPLRRPSLEDEDDNLLEAIVRGVGGGPRAEKRRRRGDEDDEDEMERLAGKAKRPDLGGQKQQQGQGARRMKVMIGYYGGESRTTGAKDGDTG